MSVVGATGDVNKTFTNKHQPPQQKERSLTPTVPTHKPVEWGNVTQKPADPTLDYSILLIAKPIPFQFRLVARDAQRASTVRDLFDTDVRNGEFQTEKEYWGPDQGRGMPVGWGKV